MPTCLIQTTINMSKILLQYFPYFEGYTKKIWVLLKVRHPYLQSLPFLVENFPFFSLSSVLLAENRIFGFFKKYYFKWLLLFFFNEKKKKKKHLQFFWINSKEKKKANFCVCHMLQGQCATSFHLLTVIYWKGKGDKNALFLSHIYYFVFSFWIII